MTKAQLISQITAFYTSVGTPTLVVGSDSSQLPDIRRYSMPVFSTGLSEKDKQPLFADQVVNFTVYKEGTGDEAAYLPEELVNTVNKDVTADSTSFEAISKLYYSDVLQNRTLAAIITQCTSVFMESPDTTNHANRMKLVSAVNQNLPLVVMEFMGALAQNPAVQSLGTSVPDSSIMGIVSSAWNSYASLIVA